MTYLARVSGPTALPLSVGKEQKKVINEAKHAFSSNLGSANTDFSWKRALLNTAPFAWINVFTAAIPIPTIGYLAMGWLVEKARTSAARSRTNFDDHVYMFNTLNSMLNASEHLSPEFIAKQLLKQGNKTINESYLAGLKEADGTKFNAVVELLQSRQPGKMSATSITLIVLHWFAFTAYMVFNSEIANAFK